MRSNRGVQPRLHTRLLGSPHEGAKETRMGSRGLLLGLVGALLLAACGPAAAPTAAPSAPAGGSGAAPSARVGDAQAAPAAEPSPAPRARLKLTYPSGSVASLQIFAARDGGFFERNGLEVETLLLT